MLIKKYKTNYYRAEIATVDALFYKPTFVCIKCSKRKTKLSKYITAMFVVGRQQCESTFEVANLFPCQFLLFLMQGSFVNSCCLFYF